MINIYKKGELPKFEETYKVQQGDGKYFPPEKLIKAVELALLLNKPLLIAGEPGTGKTDAAYHIAKHFEGVEDKPLVFNTQTTSTAKDLLYTYNSLAHFQYSRNDKADTLGAQDLLDKNYITYNPLGEAISNSKKGIRNVVLIDEIDKAPRDLPNDMLDILENMRFTVDELKIHKKKDEPDISDIIGKDEFKPIVILTTNSEKTLPEPFLRRCIFFYINFDEIDLKVILKNKLNFDYSDAQWDFLIGYFYLLRAELTGKKPATAELIMWAWILHKYEITPEMLNGTKEIGNKAELLKSSYSVLIKDNTDWQALNNKEIDFVAKKMKS